MKRRNFLATILAPLLATRLPIPWKHKLEMWAGVDPVLTRISTAYGLQTWDADVLGRASALGPALVDSRTGTLSIWVRDGKFHTVHHEGDPDPPSPDDTDWHLLRVGGEEDTLNRFMGVGEEADDERVND